MLGGGSSKSSAGSKKPTLPKVDAVGAQPSMDGLLTVYIHPSQCLCKTGVVPPSRQPRQYGQHLQRGWVAAGGRD